MNHICMVYHQADVDFANRLRQRIEKDIEIEVHLFTEELLDSDEWKKILDKDIQDALTGIVLISPDALASPHISYFSEIFQATHRPLIPIMLRTPLVLLVYSEIDPLDFREREPWGQLGRRLWDSILPVLLLNLYHISSEVRTRAVEKLGNLRDERSVLGLLEKFHDPSLAVRMAAIRAVSQIMDERAIPRLEEMSQDDDPELAEAAKIGLARFYEKARH